MQKKRSTSIQLPDTVSQAVADAIELTGESLNSLVVPCIQRSLAVIVAEIMERKREKLLAFYEKSDSTPPSASRANAGAAASAAGARAATSYRKAHTTGTKNKPKPFPKG